MYSQCMDTDGVLTAGEVAAATDRRDAHCSVRSAITRAQQVRRMQSRDEAAPMCTMPRLYSASEAVILTNYSTCSAV